MFYIIYQLKHEISPDVQGLHWTSWYKIIIPRLSSTCA